MPTKYGRKSKPVFKVVGWKSADGDKPAPAERQISAASRPSATIDRREMDDEIPFLKRSGDVMLEPDRDQLEIFVEALFRYAGGQGFVSLRAFYEDGGAKPFASRRQAWPAGLPFLIDAAEDDARRAANCPKPVVFCPPLATFRSNNGATEKDIAEGLALSVECDADPQMRALGSSRSSARHRHRAQRRHLDRPADRRASRQAASALAPGRAGNRPRR